MCVSPKLLINQNQNQPKILIFNRNVWLLLLKMFSKCLVVATHGKDEAQICVLIAEEKGFPTMAATSLPRQ
jgi:hypothetical protein